jgi:hypothetical protein
MPEPEERDPEEVEVIAHSDDEDEELTAGCYYNGADLL